MSLTKVKTSFVISLSTNYWKIFSGNNKRKYLPSPLLVLFISLHITVFVQMESCFTYLVICLFLWASLVSQKVKNLPEVWETWVQSCVWRIPWRRVWQPALVFLPGEFLFLVYQSIGNSLQYLLVFSLKIKLSSSSKNTTQPDLQII